MRLHRYERIWLIFGVGTLVLFLVVLAISAFSLGMKPPGDPHGLRVINAQEVDRTPPFDAPGLQKVGPKEYEAVMTAFMFGYHPRVLEIPQGATVHFKLTSKDVVHGFQIPGTNVNLMVVPGHVNSLTHTFDRPGEYLILCNEYCGAGHQFMAATLSVK